MGLKLVLLSLCCTTAFCFNFNSKDKTEDEPITEETPNSGDKKFFGCKGCCVVWPGPAIGKKCIFPFTWQGRTYNSCAYEPTQGDKYPWCSTKVDSNGNHVTGQNQWGKCSNGCAPTPPTIPPPTIPPPTIPPPTIPPPTKPPTGSCDSCPKPGVVGGFMEYSQVVDKLAALWANSTEVSNEAQENAIAIEGKCSKEKCEENEANAARIEESLEQLKADTITVLEENMASLMEQIASLTSKVAANEAALIAKCDATKCGSIETQLTQVESCLGDVTSTDCPTIFGKTGLVATISSNTAALADKCDVTECTAIQTDITAVESCLSDKSSGTCPAAPEGGVSILDSIISLETPPVFNCVFNNGDVATTVDVLAPYTCDINEGNIVDATAGIFTATRAGKYRLTFMALNIPILKKKVIALLVKTSGGVETKIARSVAQSLIGVEDEQITTTIDIIHDLKVGDTIHVTITVKSGTKIVGTSIDNPQQVTFTGEFIRGDPQPISITPSISSILNLQF